MCGVYGTLDQARQAFVSSVKTIHADFGNFLRKTNTMSATHQSHDVLLHHCCLEPNFLQIVNRLPSRLWADVKCDRGNNQGVLTHGSCAA
jgi:hypothetical protein